MHEGARFNKKKRINKGFKHDIHSHIFLFLDFTVMWVLAVVYRNVWKSPVFEKVFCVTLRLLHVDGYSVRTVFHIVFISKEVMCKATFI